MEYKLKSNDSTRRQNSSPSPEEFEKTIREFICELRSRFRQQSEQEPTKFKRQDVKLVRQHLPPQPGRSNNPRIDSAARMIQHGASVKEVLRSQILDFDRLDSYGRYLAEEGLHPAMVRMRRRFNAG